MVPFGSSVTALSPTIIHTGASICPASGAPQDFTNPVTYTVTGADSTKQDYVVTVTKAATAGFKLAFVSLGGSLTTEQFVATGGLATEPAAPTRDEYTFNDWYKTIKYDIAWNFNSDVITANTVVYAKWTRTNPETFLEADRPALVMYDEDKTFHYGIRLPWNYGKPNNATCKYPLFISFHTTGGPISSPTPPTGYPSLVLSPKLPEMGHGDEYDSTIYPWLYNQCISE
jgi:uncharacterized repeat protein (TIGR02543 family)